MKQWLKANSEVDGEDLERHDKWLCMMWPRLHLLRELLADNGVIFISIDDNEQHHLRMLMDEIFGAENFFAVLTRRAMHTVRNSSKDFNMNADYVLAYAKDKSWFSQDPSRYIRHLTDKSPNYPFDDNDGMGKYKLDPLHARNYYEPYTFTFSNGVVWSPPSGRYPGFAPATLRQLENDGRISFSGKEPRVKRYLNEVQQGQPPDAVLSPDIAGFNSDGTRELREIFGQGGIFPQPKPTKLVKFLLEILRQKDALVLDSTAGSGTTAHAVLALNREDGGNRKFILIECEEYADSITAERVRRVINGVPNARDQALQNGLGGSFAYYTLGDPIDTERILIGKSLPDYPALAAYLLYAASGASPGDADLTSQNDDGLFHSDDDNAYHLLYEPDLDKLCAPDLMLTETRARRIAAAARAQSKRAIVFGPGKYISQRALTQIGVTFCQIPYEMNRLGG